MNREDFINFSGFTQPGRISLPRASTSSTGSASGDSNAQEGLLPIANIGRIMKEVLPPEAKVSKRAKETIQECATEFIGFVTGEASERCRRERVAGEVAGPGGGGLWRLEVVRGTGWGAARELSWADGGR
jgi:histone H3/H4